jgi:PAS domain-containing protein
VGIDQFAEYKGWWLDTGKLIEPEEWAVARAIHKGETSLNEEIEIECFDGTHKIILNSAIPVTDEQGKILWSFIVNQDITERKQHEQALKQTNELLERFFARITSHIAYMDRDFNFIRVNESYAASAGYPPEFFPGLECIFGACP